MSPVISKSVFNFEQIFLCPLSTDFFSTDSPPFSCVNFLCPFSTELPDIVCVLEGEVCNPMREPYTTDKGLLSNFTSEIIVNLF